MKLKIEKLSKEYGEIKALSEVSMELEKTSVMTLVGPSGGGKSTMLRVLGGLEIPDSGDVLINEKMVNYNSKGELIKHRQSNGFLFQSFNLFPHRTALENITLPLEVVHGVHTSEAYETAYECLIRFGLESHAEKMPYELSGGQQQRVGIARAIASKPALLFLDEPTSALDPEMTAEVLDLIAELKEAGQDIILTTHEMGFAKEVSDVVAFLDNGQINEIDKPRVIFDRSKSSDSRLDKFLSRVTKY